jgi:hypothetical protein
MSKSKIAKTTKIKKTDATDRPNLTSGNPDGIDAFDVEQDGGLKESTYYYPYSNVVTASEFLLLDKLVAAGSQFATAITLDRAQIRRLESAAASGRIPHHKQYKMSGDLYMDCAEYLKLPAGSVFGIYIKPGRIEFKVSTNLIRLLKADLLQRGVLKTDVEAELVETLPKHAGEKINHLLRRTLLSILLSGGFDPLSEQIQILEDLQRRIQELVDLILETLGCPSPFAIQYKVLPLELAQDFTSNARNINWTDAHREIVSRVEDNLKGFLPTPMRLNHNKKSNRWTVSYNSSSLGAGLKQRRKRKGLQDIILGCDSLYFKDFKEYKSQQNDRVYQTFYFNDVHSKESRLMIAVKTYPLLGNEHLHRLEIFNKVWIELKPNESLADYARSFIKQAKPYLLTDRQLIDIRPRNNNPAVFLLGAMIAAARLSKKKQIRLLKGLIVDLTPWEMAVLHRIVLIVQRKPNKKKYSVSNSPPKTFKARIQAQWMMLFHQSPGLDAKDHADWLTEPADENRDEKLIRHFTAAVDRGITKLHRIRKAYPDFPYGEYTEHELKTRLYRVRGGK